MALRFRNPTHALSMRRFLPPRARVVVVVLRMGARLCGGVMGVLLGSSLGPRHHPKQPLQGRGEKRAPRVARRRRSLEGLLYFRQGNFAMELRSFVVNLAERRLDFPSGLRQ